MAYLAAAANERPQEMILKNGKFLAVDVFGAHQLLHDEATPLLILVLGLGRDACVCARRGAAEGEGWRKGGEKEGKWM